VRWWFLDAVRGRRCCLLLAGSRCWLLLAGGGCRLLIAGGRCRLLLAGSRCCLLLAGGRCWLLLAGGRCGLFLTGGSRGSLRASFSIGAGTILPRTFARTREGSTSRAEAPGRPNRRMEVLFQAFKYLHKCAQGIKQSLSNKIKLSDPNSPKV